MHKFVHTKKTRPQTILKPSFLHLCVWGLQRECAGEADVS